MGNPPSPPQKKLNGRGRQKLDREEFPDSRRNMNGYILTSRSFKERTFEPFGLNRGVLNFCVRRTSLQETIQGNFNVSGKGQ